MALNMLSHAKKIPYTQTLVAYETQGIKIPSNIPITKIKLNYPELPKIYEHFVKELRVKNELMVRNFRFLRNSC